MMTSRRWRSRVDMLHEGSTDGKYKRTNPDWSTVSGLGVSLTGSQRSEMSRDNGLCFMEAPVKHNPGSWK